MHPVLLIFLILLVLKLAFELTLNVLNSRHVEKHRGPVPPAFADVMDQATYDKASDYTQARLGFARIEEVFDAALLGIVLASGVLVWMYEGLTGFLGTGIWGQAGVLFLITFALGLPSLPFEYYNQFKLEQRFGFNKSTLGLWISDKVKGLILNVLLMIPLLAGLLWLVRLLPETWWIVGFVSFFGISLLLMVLYPMVILPWFNKLEPLEQGELRDRLMGLAERTGFRAKTIQVMDGSKRSGHSNAFFTGFGKFRRIVLFDTLMEQLKQEELEAVLAHEIGHDRLGHIPKLLTFSAIGGLFGFWALYALSGQAWFLEGFGFSADSGLAPAFLLFGLVSGVVTFWVSPLSSIWSRKFEYEADRFARDAVGGPESMIAALHLLSQKNLSNLTPHPLYSAWYYSHPTLFERETALKQAG